MSISFYRLRRMLNKEIRQMFRDPRMKPIVFVSPIIQLLIFGYAVNTDVRDARTFVVDHDNTQQSRLMISTLTSSGYFTVSGHSDDPHDMIVALDGGSATLGIQIPPGFAADVRARRGHLQVIIDGTNSNTGTVLLGYVARAVESYSGKLQSGANRSPIDLRVRAWFNPELESQVYNIPGVIGVLILLMTLLLTSLSVVREREIGTLDQLMVSPLRPVELILGKTIPVALIALFDILLISVVAIFWFGIPLRGSVLVLLPAALLYIVAGLSVGLLISAISKTQQEAFMTMFLFGLPAIILSGFFYPVNSMPTVFQWITLANPVRHFLEVARAVFLKGSGIDALTGQYVALLVMSAAGLWLAVTQLKRSLARA